MNPAVNLPELIGELFMETLLLYATFIFWRRYRRTSNRILLVLTIIFVLFFVAHTIFALILEDLLGYEFADPFDPHHVFFAVSLVIIIYLTYKTQWRVKLPKPRQDDEDQTA